MPPSFMTVVPEDPERCRPLERGNQLPEGEAKRFVVRAPAIRGFDGVIEFALRLVVAHRLETLGKTVELVLVAESEARSEGPKGAGDIPFRGNRKLGLAA